MKLFIFFLVFSFAFPWLKSFGEVHSHCAQQRCVVHFFQNQKTIKTENSTSCKTKANKCYQFALKKARTEICPSVSGVVHLRYQSYERKQKLTFDREILCKEKKLIGIRKMQGSMPKVQAQKTKPKPPKKVKPTAREPSSTAPTQECNERPWLCEDSKCGQHIELSNGECRCLPGYKNVDGQCQIDL